MSDAFLVFAVIIALFFLLLLIKAVIKKKFCVICGAISGSWAIFLTLYYLGWFDNKVILGILMGQSIVGIYYLFEKRIKIFRLPALLTLTVITYILIDLPVEYGQLLFLLTSLWLLFVLIYGLRSRKGVSGFVKKLIECCKNW